MCNAEPSAAESRALAAITAGYRSSDALLEQASHNAATARELAADQPGEPGKALRLPQHRWLAVGGRKCKTKLPCIECAGTTAFVILENQDRLADYFV